MERLLARAHLTAELVDRIAAQKRAQGKGLAIEADPPRGTLRPARVGDLLPGEVFALQSPLRVALLGG